MIDQASERAAWAEREAGLRLEIEQVSDVLRYYSGRARSGR
jgi:hypothetical protein